MGLGKARTISFKEDYPFDKRLEESKSIATKYPDRVPIKGLSELCWRKASRCSCCGKVIIERYSRTALPDLEKKKYLIPRDMSVGQFIHVLSSRLQLAPGKALFVFVNNTLPPTASRMDSVYQSYKDDDGFLYMCYSTEKTFG